MKILKGKQGVAGYPFSGLALILLSSSYSRLVELCLNVSVETEGYQYAC